MKNLFNKDLLFGALVLLSISGCSKAKVSDVSELSRNNEIIQWYVSSSNSLDLQWMFHECSSKRPKIVEQNALLTTLLVRLTRREALQLKSRGLDVRPVAMGSTDHVRVTQQGLEESCPQGEPQGEPQIDTFCGYEVNIERCEKTISEELQEMASNASYAEIIDLGATHQGRELFGIRIGNITQSSDLPSPQVVIVGAQHGTEVIAAEMAMRMARYYYNGYATNLDGIQDLLKDRTLTIVPVANPDGYDHWHLNGFAQRENRNPCMGATKPGVDLNRNHAFDWSLGITSTPGVCSGFFFPAGLAADSEPETQGLNALIGHDASILSGQYKTGVLASLHSSGGVIGYTPGVDVNRNICALTHKPLSGSTEHKANCTPPDQDILQEVFGTQRPAAAFLRSEKLSTRTIYGNGSKGRVFSYGMSGSLVNTSTYGPMVGTTPQTLSALIELLKDTCIGKEQASKLLPDQLDVMESDMVALVRNMLNAVSGLASGTYLSTKLGHKFALPHVYRIKPHVEHPKFRIGAKKELVTINAQPPSGFAGSITKDITIPGVHYQTWYWAPDEPDDAFVFPSELTVCEPDGDCATARINDGPVDFCSSAGWTSTGWGFVGRQTNAPSKQCYWKTTSSFALLDSEQVDLTGTHRTRLVFSYNLDWSTAGSNKELRVYVSDNGFQNCSVDEGTGCRLIHTYFASGTEFDRRTGANGAYRTEMFDVSDFDAKDKVAIRFVANNGIEDSVQLYDVHFMTWVKE